MFFQREKKRKRKLRKTKRKRGGIKGMLNGWKIEFSEKGKDYYEKMKVKYFLTIGVAGVGNKGKSFLLS